MTMTTTPTPTKTTKTRKTSPRPVTKRELCIELAKRTDNHITAVAEILNALSEFVTEQLAPTGPGVVIIPDLIKLRLRVVAPRPERQTRNPSTGEWTTAAAKPSYVKAIASPIPAFKRTVIASHA